MGAGFSIGLIAAFTGLWEWGFSVFILMSVLLLIGGLFFVKGLRQLR